MTDTFADYVDELQAEPIVTCDGCEATSEAGWGDNPFCLDCSPTDEVCDVHQRTFLDECPLCDEETV